MTRKNFDKCFDMLLKHEGGFVNHPEDPGGATNLGVTKRVMQEFLGRRVSMSEMQALTPEDVKPIYRKLYADKVRFDDLPAGLDWALNSGMGRAAKRHYENLLELLRMALLAQRPCKLL